MKRPELPKIRKPKKDIGLPKLGQNRPHRPGIIIGKKRSKGY